MNLYELAGQSAKVAAANGFAAPSWDTLPTKVALAMTEIDEAASSIHESADGFAEELADVALRVLGILNPIWGDDWYASRIVERRKRIVVVRAFSPIEVLLFPVFSHLCRAVQCWRRENQEDCKQHLELSLLELWRLADVLGVDLDAACATKLEKNRGRGHLHGTVRS